MVQAFSWLCHSHQTSADIASLTAAWGCTLALKMSISSKAFPFSLQVLPEGCSKATASSTCVKASSRFPSLQIKITWRHQKDLPNLHHVESADRTFDASINEDCSTHTLHLVPQHQLLRRLLYPLPVIHGWWKRNNHIDLVAFHVSQLFNDGTYRWSSNNASFALICAPPSSSSDLFCSWLKLSAHSYRMLVSCCSRCLSISCSTNLFSLSAARSSLCLPLSKHSSEMLRRKQK